MRFRAFLQRWLASLLGLVDAYWAMRRPWQYGSRQPQCELDCDGDRCRSVD
ncbi:MAG: hypothetical protein VKI93_03325 [Synechococcus sp.]|nr:hypothetical protein [Synechococcus sp.]